MGLAAADASTTSGAQLHACAVRTTGALRLLTPSAGGVRGHCRSTEAPASWNQAGPQGPQGVQGPQGLPGEKGDPGAAGVSGYTYVQGSPTSIAAGSFGTADATCPSGKVPVGGGYTVTDSLTIRGDAPIPLGGWFVQATNPGTTAVSATAFALCVNANWPITRTATAVERALAGRRRRRQGSVRTRSSSPRRSCRSPR